MKLGKIGATLLAVWLLLHGLSNFIAIPFLTGDIMAILALATGIIILIGK